MPLTIGICRGYDYPDLRRQLPGQGDTWGSVRFIIDDIAEPCDVLVVLNQFYREVEIDCGEVWQIIQEPPIDIFPWIFEGHETFDRIYSPWCPNPYDSRFRLSHGALPWHVDMTYNELKAFSPDEKYQNLSWITSNKKIMTGHRDRIRFLDRLTKSGVEFDLFGYGFKPIKKKYYGLGPYRYSMAIENYSGPHYWTEKIADCFLSWTMPIYYGCTNLADYFPRESFVQIDIKDPMVLEIIKDVVKSDLYLKNREAIAEARLVLDEYQLFPFLAQQVGEIKSKIRTRKFAPYRENFTSKVRRAFKRLYVA